MPCGSASPPPDWEEEPYQPPPERERERDLQKRTGGFGWRASPTTTQRVGEGKGGTDVWRENGGERRDHRGIVIIASLAAMISVLSGTCAQRDHVQPEEDWRVWMAETRGGGGRSGLGRRRERSRARPLAEYTPGDGCHFQRTFSGTEIMCSQKRTVEGLAVRASPTTTQRAPMCGGGTVGTGFLE